MKVEKLLSFLLITFLSLASLNAEVSPEDQLMNDYIDQFIPVYDASHLGVTTLKGEDIFYDPEAYSNTHVTGYFKILLEKPVPLEPNPGSTIKNAFLGYSNDDSYLQLYVKPSTFSYFFSDGELFDPENPILLEEGQYVREGTDKNLGKYRVTVDVRLSELPIKIASSGWTVFTTKYEGALVFIVKIIKVEKIK